MIQLQQYIDHTLLKPTALKSDILQCIHEANTFDFRAVCIPPAYVSLAAQHTGPTIGVCTVIGFPLGYNSLETKLFEIKHAIDQGANELDVVINIGLVKDHQYTVITHELRAMNSLIHNSGCISKLIVETAYLTYDEKVTLARMAMDLQYDFIKTSTGFAPLGAQIEDIIAWQKIIKGKIGIKASGGIKTKADMISMIDAGATRIGTSSGVQIMSE